MNEVLDNNGRTFKAKDCPICEDGSDVEMNEDNLEWVTVYHVDCKYCKIQTKPQSNPEEAVKIWNNLKRNKK